ncbi:MAG: MFS transporter, partial [Gammaproteobacteria bacterium]|nr:MFS transporter [Gammaproteobacteria bacterium]
MQQLQLHSQSKLATLAPLFLVLIIDAMGIGLVLPLLGPMFISHTSAFVSTNMSTGMRDLLYGTTLAMFCFFMFFGAPFLGDLSDHLGRKRVLLICLFGTAVGLVISAIGVDIKSVFLLIAGRGVTGFMCGSQALAQAAIVDISDDTNKTINLSLISLASCIGFVLGPIMSGLLTGPSLLQKYGLASPFWVGAVLALLNGVVLVFTFRETFFPKAVQRLHLTKGIKVFIAAFTNKSVRRLAIIYLVAELGFSLYFQLIPIYLVNAYGATSVQISHVMAF